MGLLWKTHREHLHGQPVWPKQAVKYSHMTQRLLSAGLVFAGMYAIVRGAPQSPRASTTFPVSIRVDAARSSGPLKPIWRFFGADEPNYAYMKDGKKLLARARRAARREQVYFPRPQPADVRRRHAGVQMGLDQRLPRGRRGQTRSTTGPLWTASSTPTSSAACGRTRRSASCPKALSIKPEPYQHQWTPRRSYEEIYTGWAYPPKDYDKWARAGLSVGEALRRAVRSRGGRDVVLGGLERGEHRLLARHAGGVSQAARLRHRRRAPRIAHARVGGPDTAGSGGRFMREFLEHCLRGTNYATGQDRHADRFRLLSRQGRARRTSMATCAWASPISCATIDDGFRIVASYPELKGKPIVIGESDPEGCAACQGPQLAYRNGDHVFQLHRGQLRAQARARRAARREPRRRA